MVIIIIICSWQVYRSCSMEGGNWSSSSLLLLFAVSKFIEAVVWRELTVPHYHYLLFVVCKFTEAIVWRELNCNSYYYYLQLANL